jgi:integrase
MPRHAAGLRVVIRPDTGALTIVGTVNGERIRIRAQSSSPQLAREEAATLEAKLLRADWHGERRGARSFADAALSYLEASPRSEGDKARISRILTGLGDVSLADVDQDTIIDLKRKMLRPNPAPATLLREVIVPLRTIMRHAAHRKWCDLPFFEIPRSSPGRTAYLLPAEAERLIDVAAPHLRPLLIFLLGTGARMSEALEIEWRDVDLNGGRATFWRTKSGKRRVAELPPRTVAALANLPIDRHDGRREGPVFLWQLGKRRQTYADHNRTGGGQIKTGWRGAIRRAGLNPDLTPHDLRHTWASWHYALHHDLLLLRNEGGWSSVKLVERYAHLLPAGQEEAIRWFLRRDNRANDAEATA